MADILFFSSLSLSFFFSLAEEASTDEDSDLDEEHLGVLTRAVNATNHKEKMEKIKEDAHNRDADMDAAMMYAIDGGGPGGGDEFMAVKPWLATIKEPTNFSSSRVTNKAPDANLSLEWVYGYSAQDQRNNLRYVLNDSNGVTRMVYPAAAVGVVYNPRTHKQQFYHGHDDDITCLSMHPDGGKRNFSSFFSQPQLLRSHNNMSLTLFSSLFFYPPYRISFFSIFLLAPLPLLSRHLCDWTAGKKSIDSRLEANYRQESKR